MKTLLNWRCNVLFALFVVGFLAVARAFGEPSEQMNDLEWFRQFIISLSVGAASFYALWKLTVRWRRENKITDNTNQEIQ